MTLATLSAVARLLGLRSIEVIEGGYISKGSCVQYWHPWDLAGAVLEKLDELECYPELRALQHETGPLWICELNDYETAGEAPDAPTAILEAAAAYQVSKEAK